MARNKLSVNVVYPWAGKFRDTMIESTLDTECDSSGCGFGERDMQFTLPDTPQVRKRINLLKRRKDIKVTVENL